MNLGNILIDKKYLIVNFNWKEILIVCIFLLGLVKQKHLWLNQHQINYFSDIIQLEFTI